jgi:acetyl-CoA C-acetyltransferase
MIPVAIIGSHQTRHERRKADQNVEEMIYETVRGLLDGLEMDIWDVDLIIGAGDDVLDGRSISSVFTTEYAGAFLKEESKVEEDGAYAALYAAMRLMTGAFETALVYAYSKGSDSSPPHYSGLIADPFYLRPLGIEAITASALQASAYYHRYDISEEPAAAVAVKNRRNALKNPHAQIKGEYTLDEVMNSPVIASPLKRLDCSPVTDGGCAVLLAAGEKAEKLAPRPAWIRGVGHCSDAYYLGHRDLTEITSAHHAAQKAYRMAGIHHPVREVHVAEVHEAFSFHELMLYEALGFCHKGTGGKVIESGMSEITGSLPVNPSGGALSANPIFAAGLVRLAEAAKQISGAAGDYQIEGVTTAVAHATSGLCLQSNLVYVLSVS